MADAEPRLLDLVEDVRFRNQPGAVPYIMSLLEGVSSTLRALTIDPLRHARTHNHPHLIEGRLQLELRLLNSSISFPHLTHVRIAPHTTAFADFLLPLLCASAPKLISLDVGPQHYSPLPDDVWESPELPATTSLQQLKVSLPDFGYAGGYVDDDSAWQIVSVMLLDVLARSSGLHQLSVDPGGWLIQYNEELWERVAACCARHPHLQDVHWQARLGEAELSCQSFRDLKRLILAVDSPLDLDGVSFTNPLDLVGVFIT
jgi:hypothetical protein